MNRPPLPRTAETGAPDDTKRLEGHQSLISDRAKQRVPDRAFSDEMLAIVNRRIACGTIKKQRY